MKLLRLLDLYCGGGGCSVGYQQALEEMGIEHEITGVDHVPQKNYPHKFIQGDAIEYARQYGHLYDFIHASPPCQFATKLKSLHKTKSYLNLIPGTKEILLKLGKPYVIENVPGAADWMTNPLLLCGSMFGLRVYRHRLFENSFNLHMAPASCNHWAPASGENKRDEYGNRKMSSFKNFDILTVTGHNFILADARKAMGIDWMNQKDIAQAIPPAFTKYIMLKYLEMKKHDRLP